MSDSFELSSSDYFTTGAVGEPGQRVFYLQGREGRRIVTLKVEKEQMSALADYMAGLLAKLPEPGTVNTDLPLLEPLEAAWPVGSLGLGYDEASDRLVGEEAAEVETREAAEVEAAEGEEPEGATARFLITRAQGAAFVERTRTLLKAGRPICPMCQQPKDPTGHVCPRSNGHVVHRE